MWLLDYLITEISVFFDGTMFAPSQKSKNTFLSLIVSLIFDLFVKLVILNWSDLVDSAFHPSEVDKMSTRNFWELSGKK